MLEIKKSNQIKAVENTTSRLDYAKEYKGREAEQKKMLHSDNRTVVKIIKQK